MLENLKIKKANVIFKQENVKSESSKKVSKYLYNLHFEKHYFESMVYGEVGQNEMWKDNKRQTNLQESTAKDDRVFTIRKRLF